MEIIKLSTVKLNQNRYNKNSFTPENIGSLLIYPVGCTPENYLSCDGYILKIVDYTELYLTIGKKFNTGSEASDEFRIPDYNITGRFLQPGSNVGNQVDAGLPNITGGWNNVGVEPGYNYSSGAIYGNNISGKFFYHSSGRGNNIGGFYLNAAISSSIYGNSSTVQPPSQIVHVCIRYK